MRNLLHTLIILLPLSNLLLAAPVTLLEIGHFDATGGPLMQSAGGQKVALASGAVCELVRTNPKAPASVAAAFEISRQPGFDSGGFFLSDWVPVEYSDGSELQVRIYPSAEERDSFFESPIVPLQRGRQQIGFATQEWTFHAPPVTKQSAADVRGAGLRAAYPNPFNAVATVEFELTTATRVNLELFNLLGRRVRVLADELLPAGDYRREFDAAGLATGIYMLRFSTADGFSTTRKLTLLK